MGNTVISNTLELSKTKKITYAILLGLIAVYLVFATLFYIMGISFENYSDFSYNNTPPSLISFIYIIPIFFGIPLFILRFLVNKLSKKELFSKLVIFIILTIQLITSVYFAFSQTYNYFNGQSNRIEKEFSDLNVVYQKRFDLIPNIAKSAVALADNEKAIITTIAQARAGYISSTSSADKIKYSNQFDKVIYQSIANIENYPNLKGDQGYMQLIQTLKSTESEIADARLRYNNSIEQYNRYAQSFPYVSVLKSMDIETKKAYYESPNQAEILKTNDLLKSLDK